MTWSKKCSEARQKVIYQGKTLEGLSSSGCHRTLAVQYLLHVAGCHTLNCGMEISPTRLNAECTQGGSNHVPTGDQLHPYHWNNGGTFASPDKTMR